MLVCGFPANWDAVQTFGPTFRVISSRCSGQGSCNCAFVDHLTWCKSSSVCFNIIGFINRVILSLSLFPLSGPRPSVCLSNLQVSMSEHVLMQMVG